MEIVTKKIKRFDLESCSYKDIKSFYGEQCNKRTICLFYNKEKLITILSLEDFDQYCKDLFRFNRYLKLSSNNRIGKIEYCDKAAIKNSKLEYKSKKVYPPSALNKKLKDYTIYVSSLMYADEIYNDLVESGVDITRCIFNQLDLSKDTVERYKKYKME